MRECDIHFEKCWIAVCGTVGGCVWAMTMVDMREYAGTGGADRMGKVANVIDLRETAWSMIDWSMVRTDFPRKRVTMFAAGNAGPTAYDREGSDM